MAGASMETCQFVVLRSPWGRLGSLLDVRKRLHRTRGGFHRCIHISMVLCALLLWTMICQRFRSRELWTVTDYTARADALLELLSTRYRRTADRARVIEALTASGGAYLAAAHWLDAQGHLRSVS